MNTPQWSAGIDAPSRPFRCYQWFRATIYRDGKAVAFFPEPEPDQEDAWRAMVEGIAADLNEAEALRYEVRYSDHATEKEARKEIEDAREAR